MGATDIREDSRAAVSSFPVRRSLRGEGIDQWTISPGAECLHHHPINEYEKMKKTNIRKHVFASAAFSMLALPGYVMASDTVHVLGTIPAGSCTPTLVGDVTLDVSLEQLNQDVQTVLPDNEVELTIRCAGPARVGLLINDGNPGGLTPGVAVPHIGSPFVIVNEAGDQSVGGFYVRSEAFKGDGQYIDAILWNGREYLTEPTSRMYAYPGLHHAFKRPGGAGWDLQPGAFAVLELPLKIKPVIKAIKDLPAVDGSVISGVATFELMML